jgi:hypothetical protein
VAVGIALCRLELLPLIRATKRRPIDVPCVHLCTRAPVHLCSVEAASKAAKGTRVTLSDCLNGFTEVEQLDKANTW